MFVEGFWKSYCHEETRKTATPFAFLNEVLSEISGGIGEGAGSIECKNGLGDDSST